MRQQKLEKLDGPLRLLLNRRPGPGTLHRAPAVAAWRHQLSEQVQAVLVNAQDGACRTCRQAGMQAVRCVLQGTQHTLADCIDTCPISVSLQMCLR